MPNKTESMGNEIKSQIATLLLKGAENGSVTEDDVQGMLKDISVSEEQLNAVYGILREQGISVVSADDDGVVIGADDDDLSAGTDDLDDDLDDEDNEDHVH